MKKPPTCRRLFFLLQRMWKESIICASAYIDIRGFHLKKKRVLIIFYSFTQQTRILLKKFIEGLEGEGIEVALERLEPLTPYDFPFKTNLRLALTMVMTFFCKRDEIHPVSARCFEDWDIIVLAGPTWSYHPSGPMLDFLDRYGRQVCAGRKVIPFISCRSYWRLHYWTIKRRLQRYGARPTGPIVFEHPINEPWRFFGLILQLRGKMVRKEKSWFRKHYPGYGHSKEQGDAALKEGRQVARSLLSEE